MTSLRISFPTVAAAIMATGFAFQAAAQDQELAAVVVTASGHEQNIADAPASISVITKEEIEKKSYTSIVDAIKHVPGVVITGGGSSQDVSIRGMSKGYTLFLVDGKPLSSGSAVNTNGADGGKHIGLPPVAMIERIEVVRGPMSSLYGSEALGGVVNVITKKIAEKWTGSVDTEFTKSYNDISNDGNSHSAYVTGPIVDGLLGIKINGGYTAFDESNFIGGTDSAESRPETKRRQGGVELVLTPNSDNVFKLNYRSARQETLHTPGVSTTLDASGDKYIFDKDVYTLSHDITVGDVKLSSYFQQDISEKLQEQTKKEKVNTFGSQGSFVFLEKHFATVGFEYKQEDLIRNDNSLYLNNVPGSVNTADRWSGALFGEVDWSLTDKLNITSGARFIKDENYGSHISPRLYAVYRSNAEWTLKGGVSTGYKQPGLSSATAGIGQTTGSSWRGVRADAGFALPGSNGTLTHNRALIIGNPNLKPESSTSFEFGTAFASNDGKLAASAMVFHTNFKDKILEDRYCSGPQADRNKQTNWSCEYGGRNYWFLSTQRNAAKAQMQGLELTSDYYVLPTLKIAANYTYTKTAIKSGEFYGQPLNKQPKHMFNAMIDWDVNGKWSLWSAWSLVGSQSDYLNRDDMANKPTPGYGLLDVGVVYKMQKNATFKAGLYNVANKEITNSVYEAVLDGRRLNVGLKIDF